MIKWIRLTGSLNYYLSIITDVGGKLICGKRLIYLFGYICYLELILLFFKWFWSRISQTFQNVFDSLLTKILQNDIFHLTETLLIWRYWSKKDETFNTFPLFQYIFKICGCLSSNEVELFLTWFWKTWAKVILKV